MKKLLSALVCCIIFINVQAQQNVNKAGSRKEARTKPPICYVGLCTGINSPSGLLGFDVNIPVSKMVTLDGGAGNSTWGNKVYIGAKYYLRPFHRGWAFGGGLTFNSGSDSYKTKMETIFGTSVVTLSLKPQTNIFVGAYHYWKLGKNHNRVFIQVGESIRLSETKYEQLAGNALTIKSDRFAKFMAPGGFMIGGGISFALHNRYSNW